MGIEALQCRYIETLNFDNSCKIAPTKQCSTSFHQKSTPMAFNVFCVCIIQTDVEKEEVEEKQKGKWTIKWNGKSKVFRYCCQILLRLTFVRMNTHRNIRGMPVMKMKSAEKSKFEGHYDFCKCWMWVQKIQFSDSNFNKSTLFWFLLAYCVLNKLEKLSMYLYYMMHKKYVLRWRSFQW